MLDPTEHESMIFLAGTSIPFVVDVVGCLVEFLLSDLFDNSVAVDLVCLIELIGLEIPPYFDSFLCCNVALWEQGIACCFVDRRAEGISGNCFVVVALKSCSVVAMLAAVAASDCSFEAVDTVASAEVVLDGVDVVAPVDAAVLVTFVAVVTPVAAAVVVASVAVAVDAIVAAVAAAVVVVAVDVVVVEPVVAAVVVASVAVVVDVIVAPVSAAVVAASDAVVAPVAWAVVATSAVIVVVLVSPVAAAVVVLYLLDGSDSLYCFLIILLAV